MILYYSVVCSYNFKADKSPCTEGRFFKSLWIHKKGRGGRMFDTIADNFPVQIRLLYVDWYLVLCCIWNFVKDYGIRRMSVLVWRTNFTRSFRKVNVVMICRIPDSKNFHTTCNEEESLPQVSENMSANSVTVEWTRWGRHLHLFCVTFYFVFQSQLYVHCCLYLGSIASTFLKEVFIS
jgi:hypothetical protein